MIVNEKWYQLYLLLMNNVLMYACGHADVACAIERVFAILVAYAIFHNVIGMWDEFEVNVDYTYQVSAHVCPKNKN